MTDTRQLPTSPEIQAGQTAWQRRILAVDALFGTLRLAYPNFYRGEDLAAAKRFWAQDLGNARSEEIEQAMGYLTEQFPDRAPTPGQFKRLLKKIRQDTQDATPKLSLAEICSNCRGHRNSQHHHDTCST